MQKIYSSFLFLFFSVLLTKFCFAQNNDCGNNAGFETGTTAGWICKSGWYGTGPCPIPVAGVCPSFNTVLNICPCINANGTCAGLNSGMDRQVIVDDTCYGNGIDPNSVAPWLIHTVPPGGGNYALRLGDEKTGGTDSTGCFTGTCLGPSCYARAEGIRLTFNVTAQNAFFTFRFSAFLMNGGHLPEEQPRFEVLITRPNAGDSLIPNGYLKVVANNSNPYCQGTGINFHANNNAAGNWQYCDWTDVTTDLTNYIGQDIAVEFRTSDCFPGGQPTTIINGDCTTTCQNGVCCTSGPSLSLCPDSGLCSGTLLCTNQPGTHSAYAYIDAYCASTIGINELSSNNAIRIYPNPMTSFSIIEISGTKSSEVVIYDVLGKELLRRKLTANKTEIRKGDLERGIYFVRVNEYIKKLIVE